MTDLKFIRLYFAEPLHQQCIYQAEIENLAGVENGTIQTALTVDDAVSEEDLKMIVITLKLIGKWKQKTQ
jgi:hypothetical protein